MRAVCPSNHARGARCGRTARGRDRYRDARLARNVSNKQIQSLTSDLRLSYTRRVERVSIPLQLYRYRSGTQGHATRDLAEMLTDVTDADGTTLIAHRHTSHTARATPTTTHPPGHETTVQSTRQTRHPTAQVAVQGHVMVISPERVDRPYITLKGRPARTRAHPSRPRCLYT